MLVKRVDDGVCGCVRGVVPSRGGGVDGSRFFRRVIVSQRLRRKVIGHMPRGHLSLLRAVSAHAAFMVLLVGQSPRRGVAGQTKSLAAGAGR